MTGLFTAVGRRHITRLLRALASDADRLDRNFAALLRRRGHGPAEVRAFLAVTPAAGARLGSLKAFVEQVAYHGGRLAKLNLTPAEVLEMLEEFGRMLDPLLKGRFEPAREQLYLATRLVLDRAFYQVREAESQAFFGLYRAELEATDPDDLLRRLVGVLVQALGASAGRLLLLERPASGKLARPQYLERGSAGEPLIVDSALRGRHASYWSYPFGPKAVIQLGFRVPYPWLPQEMSLLKAAAARCQEALERAAMEQEIRRLEAESRRGEEEERRRIGRELHDESGQALMLLRLQLEMIERDAPPELRPRLAEAREIAGRTAVELRRIVAALSPAVLERLGLERAIRQLAARFRKIHLARVGLRVAGLPAHLPKPVEEVVYRVTQECLQNAAKHSGATRVNLSLQAADKGIRLRVSDNGAGFRAEQVWGKPKSFGLAGMRERAALLGGALSIRSAPGKGASVTLELPLNTAPVEFHGKDSFTFD